MLAESHLSFLCVCSIEPQSNKLENTKAARQQNNVILPVAISLNGRTHSTPCQSFPSQLYNGNSFCELCSRPLFPSNRTQNHLPRDLRDATGTGTRLSPLLISHRADNRFLSDFHKPAQMSAFNAVKVKKARARKEATNINMSLA